MRPGTAPARRRSYLGRSTKRSRPEHNTSAGTYWQRLAFDGSRRSSGAAYALPERPLIIPEIQWPGQVGAAHEPGVDAGGGMAALGDGPNDEALAACHIPGGEDAGDGGHPVR